MERIYPLSDEHLQHIIGMPVCAVMKNGFRYVGIAESCSGGRLVLGDPTSRFRHSHYDRQLGSQVPQAQSPNITNEQNEQIKRKTSGVSQRIVRNKKQLCKAKASSSANKAISTNYAGSTQNPAYTTNNDAISNGNNLQLDDIFLLFLII